MLFSRKSPRAFRYDYTSPGGYFITICTKDREHYFGEIVEDTMHLNTLGQYTHDEIARLSERKTVDIHERIVMPNHVHILLVMDERSPPTTETTNNQPTIVGADHQSALINNHQSIPNKGDLPNRPYAGPLLSSIVKLFKGNISKFAKANDIIFTWQRSFHDHIIRDEDEYNRIKYYIQTNPENRHNDKFNK